MERGRGWTEESWNLRSRSRNKHASHGAHFDAINRTPPPSGSTVVSYCIWSIGMIQATRPAASIPLKKQIYPTFRSHLDARLNGGCGTARPRHRQKRRTPRRSRHSAPYVGGGMPSMNWSVSWRNMELETRQRGGMVDEKGCDLGHWASRECRGALWQRTLVAVVDVSYK
jgi:hypothetical protein